MRKLLSMLYLIALALFLSACHEDQMFASLNQTIDNHLEHRADTYQEQVDFFNNLAIDIIQSAVAVYRHASTGLATGSGVIFAVDETHYYALTNNHVVYVEEGVSHYFRVHDYLGNIYSGELVAQDHLYDLAVVRFQKDESRPALRLISMTTDNAVLDERIAIIGYPASQINAITMGKVKGYQRITLSDTPPEVVDITFDVMAMDAPVKGGSSGSLVVNEAFELTGILYAGSRTSRVGNVMTSYAVPIEKVLEFLAKHGFEVSS
ncbi:MAG: serine protease [Acholeplasmataceae bacterium]|nr:MAG: serine protease [Acholeplasmataceae bacterium]